MHRKSLVEDSNIHVNRILLEPLKTPHRRRSASTSRSSKKKKNKSKRKESDDNLLERNMVDDYSSGNESVFGSSLNLNQGGSAHNSTPHRQKSASTSRSSKKKKNKSKRKESDDNLLGRNMVDDYSSGNESVFGSSLNLYQEGSARNSRRGTYLS